MALSDLLRSRGPELRASLADPTVPITEGSLTTLLDVMGMGLKSKAGVAVSEKNSLTMPAVFRAVNIIAGTCASLPLHPYRRENDVRVPASQVGHGAQLLASPHPDLTPFEFWEIAYAHLALWGNFYARKVRDGAGLVRELWPYAPGKIRTGRAADGSKVYAADYGTPDEMLLTDDEVFHIPGFGYDGIAGLSVIGLARNGIGLAMAAEEYGSRLFSSGSLSSGILQTDQRLTQEQATALKRRWQETVAGLGKSHEIAVLGSGAKFQPISIPPEDAQFIESRRFQIAEIARMFGVPPHMLMDTTNSTSWGTGIEQQGIGFVVYTLRPWLTRVEQRTTQLLRPDPVYARYSVEGLLRGDSTARAAYYTAMFNIGAFSTNDIRRLEDMGPVEGGDTRYRPLNMGALGQVDAAPTTTTSEESTDEA